MMYYADHHGFPIVTFIDTPGAYADLKSEELGQVEEMSFMFEMYYWFICIITFFFLSV